MTERRNQTVTLTVDALAAYRIVRLVTADTVTQALRERLIRWTYRNVRRHPDQACWTADGSPQRPGPDAWQCTVERDNDAPKLATLVTCRWCVGVYCGLGVVAARRWLPWAWDPLATGFALAAAAALIAGLEQDH